MKRLELPHQTADYLCPVNGLCDVYEWKTGKRIPEELIFYSKAGFQMISQKKAAVPKMILVLVNKWVDRPDPLYCQQTQFPDITVSIVIINLARREQSAAQIGYY